MLETMGDLLEEVRAATRVLSELGREDGGLLPRMSAALRATCDDVDRRLTSRELAILVVGPADGGKRILINTAIGEEILRVAAPEPAAVVRVRHGEPPQYTCELRDGGTGALPDALAAKTRELDDETLRAERALADAEREVADLRHRLDDLRSQAPTLVMPIKPPLTTAFERLLQRFIAFVRALVARVRTWRRPLPAGGRTEVLGVEVPVSAAPLARDQRFDRIVALERSLVDAEPRLEQAREAVASVHAARAAHAVERRRVFFEEVSALTDEGARGREIVEITIDHPAALLPPGLVLVDAPALGHADEATRDDAWRRFRDDLGGVIAVSPGGLLNVLAPDLLERIAPIPAHGVRGLVRGVGSAEEATAELTTRLRGQLPALFARIREESPTVVAAHVTRLVRDRLAILSRGAATATAESEAQVAILAKRRVAIAAEHRARILERARPHIDEAVRRTHHRAREALRAGIAELVGEWRASITASDSRASVDACIESINTSAPVRLRKLCDALTERIAADVQGAVDALDQRVLDELGVDRVAVEGRSDVGAPPFAVSVTELPDGEGAPPSVHGAPLAATQDAFERKRVGIGLGGAAAGAALGTLVFPGVGTAVGAVVGVLAGFVEGTGALKRQAIENARAHATKVENELAGRLDEAAPSVARDLAASIDATVESVLARGGGTTPRLFEETDRALAREREKLEELGRVRALLGAQEERFTAIAERARIALAERAAARR